MSIALRIIALSGTAKLTASASPASVSGSGNNSGAITITTGSTTVTPAGGVSPFTYSWSVLLGGFTVTSPSAATTTFSKSQAPGTSSGTVRCTVTDAIGQTATADVSVSISNTYVPPSPPTWNINNGDNIGTWVHGGAFNYVSLYATSSSNQVVFSTLASGCGGVSPGWTDGVTYSNATASGFQFGGQVPGGTTPGTYSFTVSATNPGDGSTNTIAFYITVT